MLGCEHALGDDRSINRGEAFKRIVTKLPLLERGCCGAEHLRAALRPGEREHAMQELKATDATGLVGGLCPAA
jgi:hypothetical protein